MFFTNEKHEFRNTMQCLVITARPICKTQRIDSLKRDSEVALNTRSLDAQDTLIQGQIEWVRELDDDLELLTDPDTVGRHLGNSNLTINNSSTNANSIII